MTKIIDNKTFWKYMKPILSDKTHCKPKITLVNGQDIITDDPKLAKKFSTFFEEAVSNLDIQENSYLIDSTNFEDPVDQAIDKFKAHPSILKINEMISINKSFNFRKVCLNEVEEQIQKLNVRKANTFKNIPPKLLKDNSDVCCPLLHNLVNNCFDKNEFPNELKVADVAPVFIQKTRKRCKQRKKI